MTTDINGDEMEDGKEYRLDVFEGEFIPITDEELNGEDGETDDE